MAEEKFFLGRQPILDREQKLYGFELLFRSADTLHANVTDYLQASASVIFDALSSFGLREILGKHKGFINVNADVLMSEALELLPPEKVVIELLEHVPITETVINRCRELKEKGFSIALDDHVYAPVYEPLYEIVDVIKVDLMRTGMERLQSELETFRHWKPKLLAEKVETYEQYEQCEALGFTYFQGYYFARPVVLTRTRVDVGRLAIIKLFNQLVAEVDIDELESTFKQHPNLIINLLRLVNSVSVGLKSRITSMRHAIMVLGYHQLRRWAMMALFANTAQAVGDNPLLVMAATRARLMELIISEQPTVLYDREYPDRAFMTGILSLADALLKMPIEEVVSPLNLNEDVRQALLAREGELGILLQLVEKIERDDFSAISPLIERFSLSMANLAPVQLAACNWVNGMDDAV
ncbi:diguanylate phosphodiesterase [Geobacter metallireducens RCH3]|uniref:Cyclic diguanylate phosphodiesterase n=1 Tax=Geobacter metallireducens (strain ATCC 53774 / DSM 7210 / GS-15) TaxID=269799 RepID=Q39SY2_GEOMG|nr:EAL domain-containing protein [Geobacter metallireducens]ABB32642.1 cyclic diguanylate phosphodiesterase [Geobacter metallireducens GS-15]EHP87865.1 diguanylate phosphodiesterase [Geobacter metallireducens RCH3]